MLNILTFLQFSHVLTEIFIECSCFQSHPTKFLQEEKPLYLPTEAKQIYKKNYKDCIKDMLTINNSLLVLTLQCNFLKTQQI